MTSTPFSRTFQHLLRDHHRSAIGLIVSGVLVLAAWTWWVSAAHVTLYEVSTMARLELNASTYPVQSPLFGRIVSTTLHVGQEVRQGQVLVEIDAQPLVLQLQQEEVRARGLDPQLLGLRLQVAAEGEARAEERRTAALVVEEAGDRERQAEADAQYAEAERARTETLHARGLVPVRDLEKVRADAARLRALVVSLATAVRRIPQEQATRDRERDVQIERLNSEVAALDAERRSLGAGIERLGYEIDRRRVRAPIDGTIGESALLRPGAEVREGEKLASIPPAGDLMVAAQFPADRVFGRIRPEQPATLRLDGFPWAEFGAVSATVARVAGEIRDGTVRVELRINPQSTFGGRLEHGMPGSLEVAVERVTPLALLLRTAGQMFAAGR